MGGRVEAWCRSRLSGDIGSMQTYDVPSFNSVEMMMMTIREDMNAPSE